MRKVKHWLHILLTILTSGLWLPIYLILAATTEMFNRGYREGKAAGRVARQNEIDEEGTFEKVRAKQAAWSELQDRLGQGDATPRHFSGLGGTHLDDQGRRVIYDGRGNVGFGCTMTPIVEVGGSGEVTDQVINEFAAKREQSRGDRFADLAERNRLGGLNDQEFVEFTRLRQELSR